MKPSGSERHRRAACEAEGAGTNESNALQRSHHANAFTLIELLVVIAIIAILIGLLFPAFSAVQNQARKAQAKNDLTQIVNAVNAYYTEYGKYPVDVPPNNTSDAYFGSGTAPPRAALSKTNDWLFDVLRNNISSTKTATNACTAGTNLVSCLNPRQIVFISPRVLGTTPARSAIGANGQYYDSWGTAYNTAIDTNYNNVVVAPGYTDLAASYTTATNGDSGVPTGVIGWSYGKNQMQAASFTGSDDVISWQ